MEPSVSERTTEMLLALIQDLEPGSQLPSERELSEDWGVARGTVRSAIKGAVAENLVNQRPGAGNFVALRPVIRNLKDLVPFEEAARRDGHHFITEVLACEIEPATMPQADALEIDMGSPLYSLVRLRTLNSVPSIVEISRLSADTFKDLDVVMDNYTSLYTALAEEYGVQVTGGYERLMVAPCPASIGELLEVTPGTPVFYLTGLARSQRKTPVEEFESYVLPDQVQFASRLERKAGDPILSSTASLTILDHF